MNDIASLLKLESSQFNLVAFPSTVTFIHDSMSVLCTALILFRFYLVYCNFKMTFCQPGLDGDETLTSHSMSGMSLKPPALETHGIKGDEMVIAVTGTPNQERRKVIPEGRRFKMMEEDQGMELEGGDIATKEEVVEVPRARLEPLKKGKETVVVSPSTNRRFVFHRYTDSWSSEGSADIKPTSPSAHQTPTKTPSAIPVPSKPKAKKPAPPPEVLPKPTKSAIPVRSTRVKSANHSFDSTQESPGAGKAKPAVAPKPQSPLIRARLEQRRKVSACSSVEAALMVRGSRPPEQPPSACETDLHCMPLPLLSEPNFCWNYIPIA